MKNLIFGFLAIALMVCNQINAQTTIILQDKFNKEPISNATYFYGSENGISNDKGEITLNYKEQNALHLSHVSYGSWAIPAEEMKTIFKTKLIEKDINVEHILPITIIGVHQQHKPNSKLAIEDIDLHEETKLMYDGGELLKQTPSINGIRKSGSYAFDPVFRGYKYNQLNIVLDGMQTAMAACPNRMDPATTQMTPNLLDRVEILKGPFSFRNGVGLGGSINFISVQNQYTDSLTPYGRASVQYESNKNNVRTEAALGLRKKVFDIQMFGSFSRGEDYIDGNKMTVQSDYKRYSFGSLMSFKLNKANELTLGITHNKALDIDFPALKMDLRDDHTWLAKAIHKVSLNNKLVKHIHTKVFGTFVNHKMDNDLKMMQPKMMYAVTDAKTRTYGGRTEFHLMPKKGHLYLGLDEKFESAKGIRERHMLMGPMAGMIKYDNIWQDAIESNTGIFAEYQIAKNKWDFLVSSRIDFNYAKINDAQSIFLNENNNDANSFQINPNISLGAVHHFDNKINLGFWLGRGQRSGSITERFINYVAVGNDPYEMLGNPNIKPECNTQLDINLDYNVENTAISLTVFNSLLHNAIVGRIDTTLSPYLNSPGVRRFINVTNAYKTGFEFNWNQYLFAGISQNIGMAYTYAQDLDIKEPLPEIAPFEIQYGLKGEFFEKKLKAYLNYRIAFSQPRYSVEYGESETPTFNTLDTKISYQFNKYLYASFGINNILNENYYEHLNRSVIASTNPIYAPGRSFIGTINVQF